MADNDIQGLSAEILGDATGLFRTLEVAEARMRAFYQQWGKTTVAIGANLTGPQGATGGAGGQAGLSHELIAALRQPAGAIGPGGEKIGGQFARPAVAVSPVDQAIKNNEAALAGRINASARTVAAAVTVPSQASVAPPPTTVGPAAAPIVQPAVAVARAGETANLEQAAAQAQERAARLGRPIQYAIPGGGFRRAYPPSAGGPVGVEGGETVGGFGIPVTRGITGAEEAGGAPSQEEVLRSQASRIQQLESQIAARSQAGRAGGLARAATAVRAPAGAVSETGERIGGRFVPVAVVAPQPEAAPRTPPVVAAAAVPAQAAAQINYPEGVTPAMMKPVAGQPIEEQALYLEALGMRQEANELRRQGRQQVGGPSGLATASAAAAGRAPARLPRVTLPEERQAVLAGSPELTAVQQQIQQAQEQVFAAVSRPTSPRVATARLVGGLFGLPDIEALKRTVTERTTLLKNASEQEFTLKDRLTTATDALAAAERGEGGNVEVLRTQQQEASKAYDEARGKTEQYSKSLDEATGALESAGAASKTFASSFIGGVAGGLAFGAAMQVVSGTLGVIDKAVGPVIERFTGYQNVMAHLTDTLSNQTREAKGQVAVVLAQAEAQANLNAQTAAAIQPILAQRTATEASNKAFSDQIDLYESAQAVRNQNLRFAARNPATAGFDQGLFQTTGGLNILGVQTPLFGTPSTQELTGRVLQQSSAPAALTSSLVQQQLQQNGGLFGGITSLITGNPLVSGAIDAAGGLTAKATDVTADLTERASFLNEQMKKGGEATVRYQVNVGAAADASKELANRQADLLKDIAPDIANALRSRAGALTIAGLTGTAFQQQRQFATALQAQQVGSQTPDLQLLLAQQQPAIAAQRALFRQQAEDQRRLLLPAQFGLQQLAQPTTAFGAGFTGQVPTTVGGQRLNVPAALQGGFGQGGGAFTQSFAALAPTISGVDQQIVKLQQDGQRALEALVPADQISEFRALESQIKSTGSAIAGIQTGINQEQANYQIAQYTEQLRIATRSRTDLLQLTKQEGAAQGDNLGLLERQSIELGRQSDQLSLQLSTLQLALQQRQLNFQVAVAGFAGGPGQSPEEAALRQEAAKQQAAFQQQQLDIQKQQLAIQKQQVPISFRVQDIGFSRQLTDINRQIALINRGIRVTADVAAADQAIAHLQVLENELVKRAQTYTDESTKAIAAAESATAQIAAETGNIFGDVLKQTAKAWGIFGEQAAAAYAGITGAAGQISRSTTQVPSGQYGGKTVPYQTGFIGNVGRETHMTVGEAGTETVAVLRNPRDMLVGGGGGGGGGVTIHFNGPITVGSKDDIEQLATRVGQIVTEAMARKTSMLGFRLPTGS